MRLTPKHCKCGKDYGQSFYLNTNLAQAMEMEARTTRFLNEGTPILSCFEFDEGEAIKNRLDIKVFQDYSEDWIGCEGVSNTEVGNHDGSNRRFVANMFQWP